MITTSASPRPSHKGSIKPHQLTGYLAGAVGTAALLSAAQADAAVVAVNWIFSQTGTSTLTGGSGNGVISFGAGNGVMAAWNYFGTNTGSTNSNTGTNSVNIGQRDNLNPGSVYNTGSYRTGLPNFLSDGTVIGPAGSQVDNRPNGVLGYAVWHDDSNAANNFTSNQVNQNIAFRTNASKWGWANVTWNNTTGSLTVNQSWLQSTPDTPITVGQTDVLAAPEPSRALLALAGLGVVALRRRRKQVA